MPVCVIPLGNYTGELAASPIQRKSPIYLALFPGHIWVWEVGLLYALCVCKEVLNPAAFVLFYCVRKLHNIHNIHILCILHIRGGKID